MKRRFPARGRVPALASWTAGVGLAAAAVLAAPLSASAAPVSPADPGAAAHAAPSAHHQAAKAPAPRETPKPPAARHSPSKRQASINIGGNCQAGLAGTTYTLTGNCTTYATIYIPDGYTLDGKGYTITGTDLGTSSYFTGALVQNQGARMYLRNLTVLDKFPDWSGSGTMGAFLGVRFRNAGGSLDNVHVKDISRHTQYPEGTSIQASNISSNPLQTVKITGSTVSGFEHIGLLASGNVTVNASGSVFGPGDTSINWSGNQYNQFPVWYTSGSGGEFAGNDVIAVSSPWVHSHAMFLLNAGKLQVTGNKLESSGPADGISIRHSSGTKVAYNDIVRTGPPDTPRSEVFGVSADDASGPGTTLVCNAFSGWTQNFSANLTQPPCYTLGVTKTAYPNPAVAGQPLTFTVTITNKGPDDAHEVAVDDDLSPETAGFTWTCEPYGTHSKCHEPSGTGPIRHVLVDVAAHGKVIFKITGILPAHATGPIRNTVHITPGDGGTNLGSTAAAVLVPVRPGLPLTGPDLMPEIAGGTALLALGGLLLLPARRKQRIP